MFEGPSAIFLATLAVGLVLAGCAWFLAKRSGLLPVQTTLIETLKDTVEALGKKVDLLEEDLKDERKSRLRAERRVETLEGIIDALAEENSELRKRVGMPPRRKSIERLSES